MAVVVLFAATVVIVSRSGSSAVMSTFFDEFAAIVDWVAILAESAYIVGEFNVRLDRLDDQHADHTRLQQVACYGYVLHSTGTTHDLGGPFASVVTP